MNQPSKPALGTRVPRCLLCCAAALAFELASPGTAAAAEPAASIVDEVERARSAALFGMTQTDNVNARLGTLHGRTGCDRFAIGANIRWERVPSSDEERSAAMDGPRLTNALLSEKCGAGWAFWAGGELDIGILRPSTESDRRGVRTAGLTFGMDRRLHELAVVGAAVGYGRLGSENGGGPDSASGQTAMLYTTFTPWPVLKVDALVGVGELEFDARNVQILSPDAAADRAGSQRFGSLALQADLAGDKLRIAPYARYDIVRSQLVSFGDRSSANEDVLAMGIAAGANFTFVTVTFAPGLRVEQRRVRSLGVDCDDALADLPAIAPMSYGSAAASLTLPFRFGRAASIAFEYALASTTDAPRSESVRATLQAPF